MLRCLLYMAISVKELEYMKKRGVIAPVGFTLFLDMKQPEQILKNYRSFNLYFKCKVCERECVDLNNRKNRKVCSNECRWKIVRKFTEKQRIDHSEMAKKHGFGKWMLGRKPSLKIRQKISDSHKKLWMNKSRADTSKWKQNQKDYWNIHWWIKNKYGKATCCEFCEEKG